MPHLRFYLLGPVYFQRTDQPVDFPIRKMQALLAYLAVTATAQPRDHLLDLLWPESHPEAARKNLRNGLWQVGRTLGDDVVLATGDTLTLAGDVWCDVAEFAALMRGDARPNAGLDTQMEEATRLWRGPLLAGIRLVDAPEFELWLRNQRTLLEQVYLSGLGKLVAEGQAYARWQESFPRRSKSCMSMRRKSLPTRL